MHSPPSDSTDAGAASRSEPITLGGAEPAHLELCNREVTLVLGSAEKEQRRVLGPHTHFHLRAGLPRPHLEIAERTFALSPHRLPRVHEAIALARLGSPPPLRYEGPFLGALSPIERAALARSLRDGEGLLGCVPTSHRLRGHSKVIGAFTTRALLLLTDRELAWLGASKVGDIVRQGITPDQFSIDQGRVRYAGRRLTASDADALFSLLQAARSVGAARLTCLAASAHRSHVGRKWVDALLLQADQQGDRAARLMRHWLALDAHPTPATPKLDEALDLVELWLEFGLSTADAERLLSRWPVSPTHRASALQLSAHLAALVQADPKASTDAKLDARLDHAARSLRLDAKAQAEEQLATLAQQLGPPGLGEIALPGLALSLTAHARRVRLARLQRDAAHDRGARCHAATQHVRVSPLDREVLQELATSATDAGAVALASRAHEVARVLFEPGQVVADPGVSLSMLTKLSQAEVESLRHPLAVEHERFLARLQTLTAHSDVPDASTLSLYCERVTDAATPLGRAVDDAATLLGVGPVDVYVSRGHDDVGVRAFAGRPTLLIVGGQHSDRRSRHYLDEAELRFAVAAELAHLRFEHARVAPRQVIGGLWKKGRRGLELALGLLPVFSGLRFADRLGVATAKLSLPEIGRWMNAARELESAMRKDGAREARSKLTIENEALIEAHRFCQLTADRAGLVAATRLAASVRAMLLCRTDYVRVDSRLGQLGLLDAIDQQSAAEDAAFLDLRMRLGFLVSFYLSDEYAALASHASPARISRGTT